MTIWELKRPFDFSEQEADWESWSVLKHSILSNYFSTMTKKHKWKWRHLQENGDESFNSHAEQQTEAQMRTIPTFMLGVLATHANMTSELIWAVTSCAFHSFLFQIGISVVIIQFLFYWICRRIWGVKEWFFVCMFFNKPPAQERRHQELMWRLTYNLRLWP